MYNFFSKFSTFLASVQKKNQNFPFFSSVQFFSSQLVNTSAFNESTIYGFKLSVRLRPNLVLRIYNHTVYFDKNLDGVTDNFPTQGFSIMADF